MKNIELFNLMREFEFYSYPKIKQVEDSWFSNNSDIRWHANCVSEFSDDKITQFYLNDSYAKETRWDLWNSVIDLFLDVDIKTNLDIGCANNHFSFLCNKKNVFSLGIDPRENCVKSSQDVFNKNFDDNKYGYVGSIKTFVEFFQNCDSIVFDCITILNFLHGDGHDSDEIKKIFEILPKISKYTIISEPNWSSLELPKMTNNFLISNTIKNSILTHTLYKLNS